MLRKLWLLASFLFLGLAANAQCDLNITLQIGGCVPGSSTRPVTFTITNPDDNADEIDIYLDGVFTWSEIDIDDDMPVVFTHWFTPGQNHTIYVEATDDPDCNETLNFFIPPCPCAMSISATVSGPCSGGQVPVDVTITVSNPVGSGFNLFLDGQLVGGSPFNYSGGSSTTITIPVPANGGSHTLLARDEAQPSCSATTTIVAPSCVCSMTASAIVAGPCDAGQVPVNLTVTVNNPVGSGFNVFLDGQLVSGSPFTYGSGSSTTITIDVPGNGGSHTITTRDEDQFTCSATTSILVPNCVCSMTASAIVAGPCDGGQVPVDVTITVNNPVGSGFNLLLDGQLVSGSPFNYSGGSSTTVTINVPGNNAAHSIVSQDVVQTTCSATTSVTTPNCACSMSVAATVAGGCSGGTVPVSVTVTATNPVGSGFNLLLDGQLVSGSPFNYSGGSSTTVTINVPGNNAAHSIVSQDVVQTTCSATTSVTTPNCACSMSVAATVAGGCSGGTVPVSVTVTATNPVGSGFNLLLDGQLVSGSPFNYSGGSSTTVTLNVPGNNAAHSIVSQDVAQTTCSATTSVTTPNCACSLGISAAVSGPCEQLNVPVTIVVSPQNPVGNSFNLTLDGMLVAGSPFLYGSGSSTSVTILVPGNGAAHVFAATDVASQNCTANTTLTTPNCQGPVCSMSATASISGSCNANQQVPVTVVVSPTNPAGSTFTVTLDGVPVPGSPFPYTSGSSTTITILAPGNGASHNVFAADFTNLGCNATATFTSPTCTPPQCSLAVTATISGSCNANQQVPVTVVVSPTNPAGSTFTVTLDGVAVPGSPFPYTSGSSTTITILAPGNGASHSVVAADFINPGCNATAIFTSPTCTPPQCSLAVTASISGSCNANQQVPVTVVISPINPAGSTFTVTLDGMTVPGSPFPYTSGSSTTITILAPGNGASHSVVAADFVNPGCNATASFTSPTCTPPQCSLAVTATISGSCNANQQVPVTVVVSPTNPAGSSFALSLDGVAVPGSPFPYASGSSTSVTILVPGNGVSHTISAADFVNPNCAAGTVLTTPNCVNPQCSLAVTATISGSCNANQQVPVTVVVSPQNPAGSSFALSLDGVAVPGSPFPYASGSSTSVTILVPGNGVSHSIIATDSGSSSCTAGAVVTTPDCSQQTCALSLTASVSGDCSLNNQVPVLLTVLENFPAGTGFNVYLDGVLQPGGAVSYSASSTSIWVNGDGAAHTILVQDNVNASCSASFALTTPNCAAQPCGISNVSVGQTGPRVHVVEVRDFTFFPANPLVMVSDTVRFVWVSNIPHSTTSDALSGADAWDSGIVGIGSVFDVVIAGAGAHPYYCSNHGGPNGIGMAGIIYAAAVCEGGFANVPVSFWVENGGAGFNVFVDGQPQPGNPRPYQNPNGQNNFILNLPGDGAAHTLTLQDANTSFCAFSINFVAPDCGGPCGLGVQIQQTSPCDANDEVGYTMTVTTVNQGDSGFNVLLDGAFLPGSPFAYGASSSTSLTFKLPGDGQNHAILIYDADSLACSASAVVQTPLCAGGPCGIGDLTASVNPNGDPCVNGQLPVVLTFAAQNGSASGFMVMLDGLAVPGGPFNYAASSSTSLIVQVSADDSVHEIMVMDMGSPTCMAMILVEMPDCTHPCAGFEVAVGYEANLMNLSVEFHATAASSTTLTWDFGDGQTGQGPNPTHQYTDEGVYTACVFAMDELGCKDTTCVTVNLDPCAGLVANFTQQPYPNNPQTIEFQDVSLGGPEQWLWGFGDGATSNQQNPTHTYAQPGAYNVCLIVADAETGCFSAPACKVVFVGIIGTDAPGSLPLRLWPNPVAAAAMSFTVSGIPPEDFGRQMAVSLTDLQGRQVWSAEISGAEKVSVQVPADLSAGMYWLEMRGEGRVYRGKLVGQ